MASPSAAEFKLLFPQFAAVDDDDAERWMAQALLRFTPSRFRAQWSMLVYLFTAHHLECFSPVTGADNSGDAISRGPLTAEKVGDLSRSYGATFDMARVPTSLMWATSTKYGQELIGVVMSRSAVRGRVVRTGSSRGGTTGSR